MDMETSSDFKLFSPDGLSSTLTLFNVPAGTEKSVFFARCPNNISWFDVNELTILVINVDLQPRHGDLVICKINEEKQLFRYELFNDIPSLWQGNQSFILEDDSLVAVVISTINNHTDTSKRIIRKSTNAMSFLNH